MGVWIGQPLPLITEMYIVMNVLTEELFEKLHQLSEVYDLVDYSRSGLVYMYARVLVSIITYNMKNFFFHFPDVFFAFIVSTFRRVGQGKNCHGNSCLF